MRKPRRIFVNLIVVGKVSMRNGGGRMGGRIKMCLGSRMRCAQYSELLLSFHMSFTATYQHCHHLHHLSARQQSNL